MSFSLHKQLRDSLAAIRKPSYTSSHIAVLESLADHANEKTLKCFPSMELIADECYLTERHVQKIIKQLEQDGVLSVTRSPRRNDYRLMFPGATRTGLKGGEQASEKPASASEAPLTYSLNLESNLGESRVSSSVLQTPTGQAPGGARESAGGPASCESSNQKFHSDVLELHAYLFSNIRRETKGPSKQDVAILQGALDTYGKAEVFACLEAAFRKKKRKTRDGKLIPVRRFYWEMFKGADFPCSAFNRYLAKMMSEFKGRAKELARPVGPGHASDVPRECSSPSVPASDLNDDDFADFEVDTDELD